MFKCFFQEPEQNTIKQELAEFNKIPAIASLLPYLQILDDDKTIITKNHTLVRVIELTGFDNISTSFSEIESLFEERKNMFNNLPADLNLNFFTFKRKTESKIKDFSNLEIINKINSLRDNDFKDTYDISLFVVINKKHNFSKTNLDKYNLELNQAKDEFLAVTDRIRANLVSYFPVDLKNTPKSDFKLSRFITYILSNKETPIHSREELYKNYATTDLEFEKKQGIIMLEDRYCQIVNIAVNSQDSRESLFKSILAFNIEFDICQNVRCKEIENVKKEINKRINFNERLGATFATGIKNEDLNAAKEFVENEMITIFSYSCYIKVFGNTKEELKESVTTLSNHFSSLGIIIIKETINSKWAFLSCLSDFDYINEREIPLTSANLSDLIPFFNSFKGEESSSFGNISVAKFKNTSNLVYNFNFHKDSSYLTLGHTLVIGGTGAGKSTLIAFLLMNCLKYQDIKILAFDSHGGLKVPFTIFDGNYSDVANPNEVILNPFSLKENLINRMFLVDFLSILAGGVNSNEKAILEEVVRQNYDALENKGSLQKLEFVFGIKKQKDNQPNIAKRLEKWIKDKDLSKYFNNEKDNLIFDKKINCFDMGDILDNSSILTPVSDYIFHRFNSMIKGQGTKPPHILLVDEFQKYLESEQFYPHIKRTLKESRKNNGVFIGCVQEPSTLLDSNTINKDEFLSNTSTLILFPNPCGNKSDYQELGLNDNEFDFIKNTRTSTTNRQVLIKQVEGKSSIIDINLSSLGKYVKCFSSAGSNLQIMKDAIANSGNDWIEQFLNKAK